jgi:hypothetical protein
MEISKGSLSNQDRSCYKIVSLLRDSKVLIDREYMSCPRVLLLVEWYEEYFIPWIESSEDWISCDVPNLNYISYNQLARNYRGQTLLSSLVEIYDYETVLGCVVMCWFLEDNQKSTMIMRYT